MIDPTQQDIQYYLQNVKDNQPIVMVNLLKFHEKSQYKNDQYPQCSGSEAYDRYISAIGQSQELREKVVAEILLNSYPIMTLIRSDQDKTEWDRILIAKYPNKNGILKLMSSKYYKEKCLPHRKASVQRTQLIVNSLVDNKPKL